MFKPGDKVKRSGANGGAIYTVKTVCDGAIELVEVPGSYLDRRFILVKEESTILNKEKSEKQPSRMVLAQEFVAAIEPAELADRAWKATKSLCKGNLIC